MAKTESMEFGRKLLAAWNAMSDYQQIEFILSLPYSSILWLEHRKDFQ